MNDWDYVKEFYTATFGIDEWIVELYANLDILQLCASGASNESIMRFTELDLEDVVEILHTTFGFTGWEEDLPINPYKLYLELSDSLEESDIDAAFFKILQASSLEKISDMSLSVCRTMKEIEERIANEWI